LPFARRLPGRRRRERERKKGGEEAGDKSPEGRREKSLIYPMLRRGGKRGKKGRRTDTGIPGCSSSIIFLEEKRKRKPSSWPWSSTLYPEIQPFSFLPEREKGKKGKEQEISNPGPPGRSHPA